MEKFAKTLFLLCGCRTLTVAADKPNFGDWKLDADKSTFATHAPPRPYAQDRSQGSGAHSTTAQSGPQGRYDLDIEYDTSGKETVNNMMAPM